MYKLFRCVTYDTRGIMLLLACRKPFVTLFLLSSSGERGRIGAYRSRSFEELCNNLLRARTGRSSCIRRSLLRHMISALAGNVDVLRVLL